MNSMISLVWLDNVSWKKGVSVLWKTILMIYRMVLVATLVLSIAACTSAAPPTPAPEDQTVAQEQPQPSPTSTPTVLPPTSTPPPDPTNTSLSTNTPLPEPEETSTPEATSTPLPTSTSMLEPTPTPESIACDGTLTPTQAEGPYYTPNTPERTNLIEPGMGGAPLLVTGKVLNQNCEPIAGAMLDFWQTDDKGEYDNVGYRMRGHQFTDANGNYALETILPAEYPGRTPHIHVKVFLPDGTEALTSQIYFPGISDQIPDRIFRADLLAEELEPDAARQRHLGFDFVVNN